MRITVDGQYETNEIADIDAFNKWWVESTSKIIQQDRLIYCVEVDGTALYNEYEQFIASNTDQIRKVNIVTLSRMESLSNTDTALNDYLDRFIPISLNLANRFYGDVEQEDWSVFSQFITGLDWIIKSLEFASVLSSEYSVEPYSVTKEKLTSIVEDMEVNVEQKDLVTVADLIQYEVIPPLQQFRNRSTIRG